MLLFARKTGHKKDTLSKMVLRYTLLSILSGKNLLLVWFCVIIWMFYLVLCSACTIFAHYDGKGRIYYDLL